MPAGRGIVIEIIGDARSYVRAVESTVAANNTLGKSFKQSAVSADLSAKAQIAAAVKAQEAQRANIAALQSAAARAPKGSAEQIAALGLAADAQRKLARAQGETVVGTRSFSNANKTAERDLNKMTRGVLSGSGVLGRFSRSLAFASTGFIAFATGAEVIKESIGGAESLEKAQRSLSVAIQHTGGNVITLIPRYEAVAKAAAQFGVDQATAEQGLARATVLTGDAAAAQRAYQEALLISKATGKDFNTVLIATSKGQEGITTSLRRYGILVKTTSTGQEQFNLVMRRFGGQAAANTTAAEKLGATFRNTLTQIGIELLPTFNKIAEGLSNWLTKMNESGRLQKDVATGMSAIGTVAGAVATDISLMAKAIEIANKSVGELDKGLVALAKIKIPGFGGGGGGGGLGGFFDKLSQETTKVLLFGPAGIAFAFKKALASGPSRSPQFAQSLFKPSPTLQPQFFPTVQTQAAALGPFGKAKPLTQFFKTFQLNFAEQLAQAQAALTRSSADDVRAAKQVVSRIKTLIDEGRLHGAALVQALGLEASALGTIWSAEDAAAQKRAAAAQKARERVQAQIEASIDPLRLEVALSRAQAAGASPLPALRKLLAAAEKALKNPALTLAQQKEALDQITSLKGQIAQAAQQSVKNFTEPLKLQIALAKAQAFGTDTTPILEKMKQALLRALHSGKFKGQALVDLLNQISDINQQLNQATTSSLNFFKQLNTRQLTAGIGLTPAQRAALRARLSQVGPHGTVPGMGVGGAGLVIGTDNRPIVVHSNLYVDGTKMANNTTRHQQKQRRRSSSQRRGPNAGG